MINGQKCKNIDCKVLVTEVRKKDGQYKSYCSSVCQKIGVVSAMQKTSLERYGVKNPASTSAVKDKIKETNLEKYGVENPSHSPIFLAKMKSTNIEKYGTDKPQLLPEIEKKSKETCLKKYGVEKPQKTKDFKDRSKSTCVEKYGVDAPQMNAVIRQKSKDSCLKKYGVENSAQDTGVYERTMKRQYRIKSYQMPSGKIVGVQGYEPFAIDYLLENYSEDRIMIDTFDKPRIVYKTDDGKNHYYFPDLYILDENLIIEVKSLYTYNKNIPRNILKRQACLDAGYNFKFMIFDKHGNLLDR